MAGLLSIPCPLGKSISHGSTKLPYILELHNPYIALYFYSNLQGVSGTSWTVAFVFYYKNQIITGPAIMDVVDRNIRNI